MYRMLAVLLTGVAIATIWRRKELRNDADRASKAIVNAAATARSQLAASDGDVGPETVEGEVAADDPDVSTTADNEEPAESPA